MAPSGRAIRQPAVAGLFYPADAELCASSAGRLLRINLDAAQAHPWRGGIVPHAGWVCSGAIAGETIGTIAASRKSAGLADPDAVVVFGAVHTPLPLEHAALGSAQQWQAPAQSSSVPQELSGRLERDHAGRFAIDDRFHDREHAIEVELPLIQHAWPGAALLPIEVPLIDDGVEIGRRVADEVHRAGMDAIYLASSDLTHYGPSYRFAPAGVGIEALNWAKANDRRLLEIVEQLTPERIVPEVREHFNACGGGSVAAMLAACRERGIVEARILRHLNSYEVLKEAHPRAADDAVGYASVVIG